MTKMNKCYCIKDFFFEGKAIFKKGSNYDFEYWFENQPHQVIWIWYDKNGDLCHSGYQFIISDSNKVKNLYQKYFCDLKKVRKNKLNNLNLIKYE